MADTPLWVNADSGEPAYPANVLRRGLGALISQAGTDDGLGGRAGVMPGGPDAVTLSGSTLSYHDAKVVIYPGPSASTLNGPYILPLTGGGSDSLVPQGSSARTDIVVARVWDDDVDSSGLREARFQYLSGTTTVPSGAVRLATIDVPASGSGSPSLTYDPQWTAAAGGIVVVRDETERPTAGLYDGLTLWRVDAGWYEVWHNGAWTVRAPLGIQRATNASGVSIPGGGAWTAVPMDSGDWSGPYTVPVSGVYMIKAMPTMQALADGQRAAMLALNGTDRSSNAIPSTEDFRNAVDGFATVMHCEVTDHFNAGDQIWILQWQNSGSALPTDTNPASRPKMEVIFLGGN